MVLFKRKVLIIIFFMITVSITMVVTFLSTPIYKSTAKLIINTETSSSPITGKRIDYESYMSQTMTFNTHFKLIKSLPVINKLIDTLKLDENDTPTANLQLLLKMDDQKLSSNGNRQNLITTIQKKITISQIRDTRLLTIDVKDKNQIMAAAMATTLAEEYIKFNLRNKMLSSTQTLDWLNNELYEMRKKLEHAEKSFFEYKQKHKIFSITSKQKIAEQKIVEFNNKYLEARNNRLVLDAKLNELNHNIKGIREIANVRSLLDNSMIDTIYRKIVDLELELTRAGKIFKPKHPKIVQLKSELKKSRNRFAEEIKKELANLKSERKVLFAREKTLEKTISEFESDALNTSSKELKFTILQRNVNTSQNLYDLMVSRIKESAILQTSNVSNIRLVEKAMVPVVPVSPNKKRNLLLSIILGLFGGIGLAFFIEYLDQTVRTEDDIHNHFNLSVLSVIPEADRSKT
ncbi:MAG: GumC family protein [Desulfobacteraceae bacterium]|nr:GumC family protein [Desulfobacteraceae bacterium]